METKPRIPVAILCGGKGTRLKEETEFRPKPMVMVGDRPMIWHIMKIYAHYGFTDFLLCLGYKGDMIRDYFFNYDWNHSNVLLELGNKKITKLDSSHGEEDWRIWLIDTGPETMTGGRLKRLSPYFKDIGSDLFMGTYGDGVSNVNIQKLLEFHNSHGKLATITSVRPPSRFGELAIDNNFVSYFQENPKLVKAGSTAGTLCFIAKFSI